MVNVSPARWRNMVRTSQELLASAERARQFGKLDEERRIWQRLAPLNASIRALSQMPAR